MAETPITTQEPQPQEGNLTIADLQTISNIIDIAMTRGAFRANEAKTVGESYEKISAFLQTVQQTAADQQANQQAQPVSTIDLPPGDAGNTAADAAAGLDT
jgi:hypothetical protein